MIEINLIPDIKQELLRARRVRSIVISGAIVVCLVSVGSVILLAIYLFGVQALRSTLADRAIESNSSKIEKIPDLANMLTIQNQLEKITDLHLSSNMSSRLFQILVAVNPAASNEIKYSSVNFDSEAGIIHIEAQAGNGFVAADVFKKTAQAVRFTYQVDGEQGVSEPKPIATDISILDSSYGEDASGAKVIRFSVDLKYTPELFAASSRNVVIINPEQQDATDSYKYLPKSLFTQQASGLQEGDNG